MPDTVNDAKSLRALIGRAFTIKASKNEYLLRTYDDDDDEDGDGDDEDDND